MSLKNVLTFCKKSASFVVNKEKSGKCIEQNTIIRICDAAQAALQFFQRTAGG